MCRSPLMPPPRLFGGCARRRRGTFLNSRTSPSSQTVLTAHRVSALLSEGEQTDGGRGEWGRGESFRAGIPKEQFEARLTPEPAEKLVYRYCGWQALSHE